MRYFLFFACAVICLGQTSPEQNYDTRSYDWYRTEGVAPPFQASGDLTAASGPPKAVTLTPCPWGIRLGGYVKIDGGLGVQETAQIVSFSGSGGSSSCTLQVVTSVARPSGGWMITSSTSGIDEAAQMAGSGYGSTVYLARGVHYIYTAPRIPNTTTLQGAGSSSIIRLAPGVWPASAIDPAWTCNFGSAGVENAFAPCGLSSYAGAIDVEFKDFTFDENGVAQTNNQWGTGVALQNCTNCLINNVRVINGKHQGQGIGVLGYLGSGNVVVRSIVWAGGGASPGACPGGVFVQTPQTVVSNSLVKGLCDEGFIANGQNTVAQNGSDIRFNNNTAIANPGSATTAYHAENSTRSYFTNNVAVGPWDVAFAASPTGGAAQEMTDIHFIDNIVSPNAAGAPRLGFSITGNNPIGTSYTLRGFSVRGNSISGVSNGLIGHAISVGVLAEQGIIANNLAHGNTGRPLAVSSTVVGVVAVGNAFTANGGEMQIASPTSHYGLNSLDSGQNGALSITASPSQEDVGSLAAANVSYRDWHSSGVAHDFDFRMIASGGDAGAPGQGTMTFEGRNLIMGARLQVSVGPSIASANTIAPTHQIHPVTGTAGIQFITPPPGFTSGCIHLLPVSAWNLIATGGNISRSTSAIVGQMMTLCWNGVTWYPSY